MTDEQLALSSTPLADELLGGVIADAATTVLPALAPAASGPELRWATCTARRRGSPPARRRRAPAGSTARSSDPSATGSPCSSAARRSSATWMPTCSPLAHPHALRAYWATRCLKLGVPVHEVSARLGHADLRTTARYTATRLSPCRLLPVAVVERSPNGTRPGRNVVLDALWAAGARHTELRDAVAVEQPVARSARPGRLERRNTRCARLRDASFRSSCGGVRDSLGATGPRSCPRSALRAAPPRRNDHDCWFDCRATSGVRLGGRI